MRHRASAEGTIGDVPDMTAEEHQREAMPLKRCSERSCAVSGNDATRTTVALLRRPSSARSCRGAGVASAGVPVVVYADGMRSMWARAIPR